METDVTYPLQPASGVPPIADWLDRPEDTPRNLQVNWLTRRFGLSPTFARRVADLAFTVTRRGMKPLADAVDDRRPV